MKDNKIVGEIKVGDIVKIVDKPRDFRAIPRAFMVGKVFQIDERGDRWVQYDVGFGGNDWERFDACDVEKLYTKLTLQQKQEQILDEFVEYLVEPFKDAPVGKEFPKETLIYLVEDSLKQFKEQKEV